MGRNKFKKYVSKKRHQFSESECGMYCLYFIVEMLKGKPFSKFNGKKKINDKYMIKLRKLWFNHLKYIIFISLFLLNVGSA